MSAPVPTGGPTGGQDDVRGNNTLPYRTLPSRTSPTRRVSEGDRLEVERLRGGQLTASPGQVTAPIVSESADKDFNQRMRNMSIAQEATPPALSPHQYDYNYTTPQYSPYTPTSSHQGPNAQGQSDAWRGPREQPAYPSYTRYPSQPGYQPQPPYLEPPEFSIETMHGMPGYPGQPPIARSMQSTSPQYSSQASITPRPYGWGSPPMSPSMSTVPFGGPGQGWLDARGGYAPDLQVYGHPQPPYQDPRQGWSGPSSPYNYYTPYQPPPPQHYQRPPPRDYHQSRPQGHVQQRWTGPEHRPPPANQNRMSWSGQAGADAKDRERKAYHPQPPARRSDWVMWVGNVPGNTSHEELWRYFNSTAPSLPEDKESVEWHGPSSIFLISRSQCAFVNLSSQEDLDRAVRFFNGQSLRPSDPRCPRMVCRVRRKDDDLRAGVGAQRGTGMHREWITKQPGDASKPTEPPSPAVLEQPPEGEGRRRESIAAVIDARDASTNSMASTNSSFLVRHFPRRFFILKSLSTVELEDSVRSGTWKTQRHNEPILDQAFRTAQEVILVFSANKSGEFFGYAKMVEPIDKVKAAARAAQTSVKSQSSGSIDPPTSNLQEDRNKITEEDETEGAPQRPQWLQTHSSHFAASSPGQLTPQEDDDQNLQLLRRSERRTESPKPVGMGSIDVKSTMSAPAATQRAQTMSPHDPEGTVKPLQEPSFFDLPVPQTSREGEASKAEALGGSKRAQDMDGDGVWRKDTILTPQEKAERQAEKPEEFAPEEWGLSFKIEWMRVGILPFHRIRSLRNPWNADREVKVSRDGTEVEPATAATLLAEWDRMGYGSDLPKFPEYR